MKNRYLVSRTRAETLCAAVLAIAVSGFALGQAYTGNPSNQTSASDLLRRYQSSSLPSADAEGLLISVLNKRLPSNDENVKAVRSSLAKARTQGERILLIKMLASLYVPGAHSLQNSTIEGDIKGAIVSSDQRVAREAVLAYSRLGYPSDRYRVLQRAHSTGLLDDDLYYGELAHGLRISAPAEQSRMLTELERRQNRFATEILASTFTNPQFIHQLGGIDQARLLKLLSDCEPAFPVAVDSFGMVDAIRYAFWIDAVATLDSTLNGKSWAQLVIAHLSDPNVDPRKTLAVFSNPEGKRLIKESADIGALRSLLARTQVYSDSLPQNVVVRSATRLFAAQLNAGGGEANSR
jgi:hypothetical protein